jgi:hypothetical protein
LILTLARGNYRPEGAPAALGAGRRLFEGRRRLHQGRHHLDRRPPLLTGVPASVGAGWPFLSDPCRSVQKDLDIKEYTDPEHDPMIPHNLVLKPGLVIHGVYNGHWFWGRLSFSDLWHDLREASSEIRPDWDLSKIGLRGTWDAGDYSSFHGWNKRVAEMATSYES